MTINRKSFQLFSYRDTKISFDYQVYKQPIDIYNDLENYSEIAKTIFCIRSLINDVNIYLEQNIFLEI